MANKGKDTNTSQFFITYGAAPHLNGKHTVFGKLIGGEKTLDACEGTFDGVTLIPTIIHRCWNRQE